jgi:hypothetical protein
LKTEPANSAIKQEKIDSTSSIEPSPLSFKAKRHLKVSRAIRQLIKDESENQLEQLDDMLANGELPEILEVLSVPDEDSESSSDSIDSDMLDEIEQAVAKEEDSDAELLKVIGEAVGS